MILKRLSKAIMFSQATRSLEMERLLFFPAGTLYNPRPENRLEEHDGRSRRTPRRLASLVVADAMLPQTKLEKVPRMADFALWATACETALWPAGTSGPRRVVDPDWRLNCRGHRQTLRSSPRRRLAAMAPI
jgi:hypothetical protein